MVTLDDLDEDKMYLCLVYDDISILQKSESDKYHEYDEEENIIHWDSSSEYVLEELWRRDQDYLTTYFDYGFPNDFNNIYILEEVERIDPEKYTIEYCQNRHPEYFI